MNDTMLINLPFYEVDPGTFIAILPVETLDQAENAYIVGLETIFEMSEAFEMSAIYLNVRTIDFSYDGAPLQGIIDNYLFDKYGKTIQEVYKDAVACEARKLISSIQVVEILHVRNMVKEVAPHIFDVAPKVDQKDDGDGGEIVDFDPDNDDKT